MRPYALADRHACLQAFDSNVPRYFAPHERDEFDRFLAAPDAEYFVLEDQAGAIVGCGGYYVNRESGEAGLVWGMVVRTHHGMGIGRKLLDYRLARLRTDPDVRMVILETSQHSAGFFAKAGFLIEHIIPDGFAPGLDQVKMRLVW
jgi:GNAT superfamily N-acetyltransferase